MAFPFYPPSPQASAGSAFPQGPHGYISPFTFYPARALPQSAFYISPFLHFTFYILPFPRPSPAPIVSSLGGGARRAEGDPSILHLAFYILPAFAFRLRRAEHSTFPIIRFTFQPRPSHDLNGFYILHFTFYLSPRPSHDLNGFYILHSTFYILPFKSPLQHPTKHRLRRLQLPLRQPPLCLYVRHHGRKTGLEGEGREWDLEFF